MGQEAERGWCGWQGSENGQRDLRQVTRPDLDLVGFVSFQGKAFEWF